MTSTTHPTPWTLKEGYIVDANGKDVPWHENIQEVLIAVNHHADLVVACKQLMAWVKELSPHKGSALQVMDGYKNGSIVLAKIEGN